MAQHDYDIENSSFPAFRTNLNGVLSAINSSNSGSSRPSSAVAGTIWLDTSGAATAQLLKMYDGAADITLGTINFTANTVDWTDSSVTVADNSITLAKMASGTDGNIISYDASGNPVAVATGSAAQVLTSAGAGAPPTFATATVPDDAITLAKMASGTDGNIISYDASGNPVAIATGSDGQVLTSAGAGQPPAFETISAESNTPSFYARGDGATAIANATLTVIKSQSEQFDNGGCYNATTSSATLNSLTCPAYAFTPNVAGLYYFIGAIKLNTGTFNLGLVNNKGGTGGSESYASLKYQIGTANNTVMVQGFSVMNGSGNNVSLCASQESGGSISTNDATYTTYFGGFLVKKS